MCGPIKPVSEPRKLHNETQMLDMKLKDLVFAGILVSFDVTAVSLLFLLYSRVYWGHYMVEICDLILFSKI